MSAAKWIFGGLGFVLGGPIGALIGVWIGSLLESGSKMIEEGVAVPAKIVVVKDFGTADSNFYAILMDSRAMRLHNTYRAMRDNANGEGDFLNLFDHTEDTAYLSRNAFVKAYRKP